MRYINFLLIMFIALAFGCSKQDSSIIESIEPTLYTAGFADQLTRTFVNDEINLLWHEGDKLSVFDKSTLNRQFVFQGKTGATSGAFKDLTSGYVTENTNVSANYAVYPYNSSNELSKNSNPALDELLSVRLPAEQHYAVNSFGRDANTMVAVTSGIDDTFLPFKNVCGFLRLKIYGEGVKVMTIILKGNNGEKIAGNSIVAARYGANPSIVMADNATETITLNCGSGVALGESEAEAVYFWIAVPPTKFEKGFTVTIADITGSITTKSTENSYEIERNKIMTMAPFECKKADANQQPANQIWYTSSDDSVITPYKTDVFGANIISNRYENGKGIITFDGKVTAIGELAFSECSTLTSITIPEGVLYIGEEAFYECTAITNILIPESVINIARWAFEGCTSLCCFKGKYASYDNRCLINDLGTMLAFAPAGLVTYDIPNNVKIIGKSVFYKCFSIVKIKIPEGVTSIEESAFRDCRSLEEIFLPKSLINIESNAFSNCHSLLHITIPEGIKNIKSNTFSNCI